MDKKNKYPKSIPIVSLHYLYTSGKINFNPEYQRESVWTKSQKQLFIDSLFIGIDIPKLYFREVSHDGYEYEVVDGQQRLRATFEYLDNRYPLSEDSDPVDGLEIANKYFQDLDTPLKLNLQAIPLDIVIMNPAYTDDDIDEMFLRLQNGTPLNAAEKRRAIPGNLQKIVQDLSKDKVFILAGFKNKRYAHEDTVAKTLHQLFSGSITDIRPLSIKRTYETHQKISAGDKTVVQLKQTYNFIRKAFGKKPNPKFKKYAMIDLAYLVVEMLEHYNLSNFPSDFSDCLLDFEKRRILNENLAEEKQDSELAAFTDSARADSIQDIKYRHEIFQRIVIQGIPDMSLKDPTRNFTQEQRWVIYLNYNSKCAICGKDCDQDDYHVDHIKPHSAGGLTNITNGQLLCPECNFKKGAKEPEIMKE